MKRQRRTCTCSLSLSAPLFLLHARACVCLCAEEEYERSKTNSWIVSCFFTNLQGEGRSVSSIHRIGRVKEGGMMMDEQQFFGWKNQRPITERRTAEKQKQLILFLARINNKSRNDSSSSSSSFLFPNSLSLLQNTHAQ